MSDIDKPEAGPELGRKVGVPYSTDVAGDYDVLRWVRDNWCNVDEANKPENDGYKAQIPDPSNYRVLRARFFSALKRIWRDREEPKHSNYSSWVDFCGRYKPGDYSAALKAAQSGTV